MTHLIEKGIVQGALISCVDDSLSQEIKNEIRDSRAIRNKRNAPIEEEHLLVVLSQNCDIDQSNDHFIEVLSIKKLPDKKVALQQQENRNYRKLQLPYRDAHWSLEADLISVFPKDTLLQALDNIQVEGCLGEREIEIMVDWRVSRYNRIPFPHGFNEHFLNNYLKNEDNGLAQFLREKQPPIIDLFAYVDPNDDDNASSYNVSVTAVVSHDCSDEDAEIIRGEIEKHCQNVNAASSCLNMIQLTDDSIVTDVPLDFVLSTSDFSLKDQISLRRLTLDYLCY